jgi:hypothetical protein
MNFQFHSFLLPFKQIYYKNPERNVDKRTKSGKEEEEVYDEFLLFITYALNRTFCSSSDRFWVL